MALSPFPRLPERTALSSQNAPVKIEKIFPK